MSGEGGDGIGHHEPRAAGVFMPGLAQAPLEDPDVQALMRQKTLTLGQTDSTECLGSENPTPRRIAFTPGQTQSSLARMASPVKPNLNALETQQSQATLAYEPTASLPATVPASLPATVLASLPATPAPPQAALAPPAAAFSMPAAVSPPPTVLDSESVASSPPQVLQPENQLGDSWVNPPRSSSWEALSTPHSSPPSATEPGSLVPESSQPQPTTVQDASTQHVPSQAPSPAPETSTPAERPPPAAANNTGDGEMTGTMYTDGTYWKRLRCDFRDNCGELDLRAQES